MFQKGKDKQEIIGYMHVAFSLSEKIHNNNFRKHRSIFKTCSLKTFTKNCCQAAQNIFPTRTSYVNKPYYWTIIEFNDSEAVSLFKTEESEISAQQTKD